MNEAERLSPELEQELSELIDASLHGEITADQSHCLERLVSESRAAGLYYVRYIFDVLNLHSWAGISSSEPPAPVQGIHPDDLAALLKQTDHQSTSPEKRAIPPRPGQRQAVPPFSGQGKADRGSETTGMTLPLSSTTASLGRDVTSARQSVLRRPIVLTTALTILLLAALAAWQWMRPPVVAELTLTVDAEWSENTPALPSREGQGEGIGRIPLRAGQQLQLTAGLAEIVCNSGARVILEGPASFELESVDACRLTKGKLTAYVPGPAKGFVVATPSAAVTDLGTAFGVAVTAPGTTEVHVFEGRVEARPEVSGVTNESKREFAAGQAVRFDSEDGTVRNIPLNENSFARFIPVANHNFEAGLPLGNGTVNHGPVSGWQIRTTEIGSYYDPNEDKSIATHGNAYYSGSDQPPGSGIVGTMEGPQAGYLFGGQSGDHFEQVLSETLTSNTRYVLTVAVGVRNLGTTRDINSFGGYRLELAAAGRPLGSGVQGDFAALNKIAGGRAHGSFTDVSYTFTTGAAVLENQKLAIRIAIAQGGSNSYLDFDNVRLWAIPAAEKDEP